MLGGTCVKVIVKRVKLCKFNINKVESINHFASGQKLPSFAFRNKHGQVCVKLNKSNDKSIYPVNI